MPELSIIVPVYKVEAYLPRCLDSILAQTFKDFELILIDDGSPDRCGEIMEEYAKRDSRIVTIHQENQGISAARNAGLRIVRGQYIGFVDPDDWINAAMYERLVEVAEREQAELVCCNVQKTAESCSHSASLQRSIPIKMDRTELFSQMCARPRTINGWAVNKLFLRDKIVDLFDETLTICEDQDFTFRYCCNVSTAFYLNEALYYYFYREESLSNIKKANFTKALPLLRKQVLQSEILGDRVVDAFEDEYLDSCMLCCKWTREKRDDYYFQARRELCSYVMENRSRIMKNDIIPPKKKVLIGVYFFAGVCQLRKNGIRWR